MDKYSKSVQSLYNTIGKNFSETRKKFWQVPYSDLVKPMANVLDLGCGNARLLNGLPDDIEYVGIDFSEVLLSEARKLHPHNNFYQGDISDEKTWEMLRGTKFDAIYCVAVLHHVPQKEQQIFILENINKLLNPGGFAYISIWNLLNIKFFWKHHLKSWRLKLRNIRWLFVPYNGKNRFCTTFNKFYLKGLMKQLNISNYEIYYSGKKGNSFLSAENLVFLINKF